MNSHVGGGRTSCHVGNASPRITKQGSFRPYCITKGMWKGAGSFMQKAAFLFSRAGIEKRRFCAIFNYCLFLPYRAAEYAKNSITPSCRLQYSLMEPPPTRPSSFRSSFPSASITMTSRFSQGEPHSFKSLRFSSSAALSGTHSGRKFSSAS